MMDINNIKFEMFCNSTLKLMELLIKKNENERIFMTQPKHTPEPWLIGKTTEKGMPIETETDLIGFFDPWSNLNNVDLANAARIVSCVNALAGIPNPQAFVEAAGELLRVLWTVELFFKNDSICSFCAAQVENYEEVKHYEDCIYEEIQSALKQAKEAGIK